MAHVQICLELPNFRDNKFRSSKFVKRFFHYCAGSLVTSCLFYCFMRASSRVLLKLNLLSNAYVVCTDKLRKPKDFLRITSPWGNYIIMLNSLLV